MHEVVSRLQRSVRLLATVSIVVSSLWGAGCQRKPSFDGRLNQVVEPYRFSILGWSLDKMLHADRPLAGSERWDPGDPAATELVLNYFSLVDRIRALQAQINALAVSEDHQPLATREEELRRLQQRKLALRDSVEWIIGRQIRETLNAQGIFNPADRYIPLKVGFPPMNFELDELPHILVVSPRERIESMREVVLVQALDRETAEGIEANVDALGVSSLVVGLGGFGGTYPTFVADDITLQWTIPTAVEEWLHQYLAFTPLGFAYVLDQIGLSRNYEIATLNETLAGVFSDEVGELVLERYYPRYAAQLRAAQRGAQEPTEGEFDFDQEMRQIRLTVDDFLANGQVERAEQFMEECRQYLASQGYYIRKLNQAYFAFHGTYADEPTSVDPLGEQMRGLRAQSPSLRAFLNTASVITSRQQLLDRLGAPPAVRELSSAGQPGSITAREEFLRAQPFVLLHQRKNLLCSAFRHVYQPGKAFGVE